MYKRKMLAGNLLVLLLLCCVSPCMAEHRLFVDQPYDGSLGERTVTLHLDMVYKQTREHVYELQGKVLRATGPDGSEVAGGMYARLRVSGGQWFTGSHPTMLLIYHFNECPCVFTGEGYQSGDQVKFQGIWLDCQGNTGNFVYD